MKKKASRAKNNATKAFKNKRAARMAIDKADRAYSATVAVTFDENGKVAPRSLKDIRAAEEHLRAVTANARRQGFLATPRSEDYYDCEKDE